MGYGAMALKIWRKKFVAQKISRNKFRGLPPKKTRDLCLSGHAAYKSLLKPPPKSLYFTRRNHQPYLTDDELIFVQTSEQPPLFTLQSKGKKSKY